MWARLYSSADQSVIKQFIQSGLHGEPVFAISPFEYVRINGRGRMPREKDLGKRARRAGVRLL